MIRMKTILNFLSDACLIFLCYFTILRAAHWFGYGPGLNSALVYPAVGLSLIGGLSLAAYRRKSLYHQLIAIDRHFQLHDRLSTAYEYIQKKKESPYFDSLIQDAAQALSRVDKKKIFPRKISWIHIALGVLLAVNLLMAAIPNPLRVKTTEAVDPGTKGKLQMMIRQYSSDSSKKESDRDKRPSHGVGEKQMRDISKMLENPSVQKKRLAAAIHKALMEIQADKISFARDLLKELGVESVDKTLVQQIQQNRLLSRYQLEELNKMLAKMFDNQIPKSIAEDLAALEDHHRLEAYLRDALRGLESGETRAIMSKDGLRDGSERPTAGTVPADDNGDDSKQARDAATDGDLNRRTTSTESHQGGETSGRSSDETDDDEFGYGPSSAGLEKSQGKMSASDTLEHLAGPAVQDKAAASQESEVAVLIRSLTATGKAKVEEEEILKSYQQAVEAVIQKESIPLSYKRIIQNYFLSIRLRKELPTHERDQ